MIKAACHIHSDWSYDGKWPLPKLAAEFGRRGYGVVMITEHDLGFTEARRLEHRAACKAASSRDLLILPGIEYSEASNTVHVLVWGPVPFLGEKLPTSQLLKAVKAANGVAVLAHPSRRQAWTTYDQAWSADLLGVEIWNRKTDGWAPSRDAQTLANKTGLPPFAGMDFHDRNQIFPLSMVLDMSGPPTEDAVLECLRARHFHAAAFDRPIAGATGGWFNLALNSAEYFRRRAAKVVRSWKAGRAR